MATTDSVQAQINAILQTQIIQALNSAPEAIEKIVKAALSKPVDRNGNIEGARNFSSYGGTMPYLDWMVGEEVRQAAQQATVKVIQEMIPNIEKMVRQGLSEESVVKAVTSALVGTASQEWRISVKFESDKDKN